MSQTRAERLAARLAREKKRLERQRHHVAQLESQGRAAERKRRNHRRFQAGTDADEAGLFVWEPGTLAALFGQLARLKDVPDPVKVLEGLLSSPESGIAERYP